MTIQGSHRTAECEALLPSGKRDRKGPPWRFIQNLRRRVRYHPGHIRLGQVDPA